MHSLVICEKPSQARAYAAVLSANGRGDGFFMGNNYIVAHCLGHLLELAPPDAYGEKYAKWRHGDLPIIPEKWLHRPSKDKTAQLKIIKDLTERPDVDCIINACDAGREGELIFRLVLEHAQCKKPTKRLWISSMEDKAVAEGFANLEDGSRYDSLHAAASCRERADWLVGINATRLFSVLYGTTLNTGRVQSPTLAMLVGREKAISAFVKETFHIPAIDLTAFTADGERQNDREAAEKIAAACDGRQATVTDVTRTKKTVQPPKLHDLTALQRDANRIHGLTAQQTLEHAQSLYEKKLLSYPRTDARHISADMQGTVLKILGMTDYEPDTGRLVGKVTDHHAIIPTLESMNSDLSSLSAGEKIIFNAVRERLTAATSPAHVYEAVTATLECGGHVFTAKGKKVLTPGWKERGGGGSEGVGEDERNDLSGVEKGLVFDSATASVKEGATTPPKHHTEDTLLAAMENAGAGEMPGDAERKGLGTPATRAAIIEKLIKSGFAERSKKNVLPTQKGKNLVTVLPEPLTSARMTAEWEHRLKMVERGELEATAFMDGIAAFVRAIIDSNNAPNPDFANLFPDTKQKKNEQLGPCPRCAAPVREAEKGFFCDSRVCGFKLWKESKFWTAKKKPLTGAIVAALLKDGRVALKDLHSEKTGKTYRATVILDDSGDKHVNFKMEFPR